MKSVLLILSACFLAACTTAEVKQTRGGTGSTKISKIQVGESGLAKGAKEEFVERDIAAKLHANLLVRLQSAGKMADKGADLVVTVTDMRIRGTATVYWLGMMAGADTLIATVQVVANGKVVREFSADAGKWGPGIAGLSATGRVNRMCEELAIALANQL